MAQMGTVQEIKGQHVFVKIIREEACAHCQMCTTGINEGKECLVEAINACNATVGETVELDIQTNYFLRATAIMYGMPLLSLLLGLAIASATVQVFVALPYKDMIVALIGFLFMGLTYVWIRKREKNKKHVEYLPIAISKK